MQVRRLSRRVLRFRSYMGLLHSHLGDIPDTYCVDTTTPHSFSISTTRYWRCADPMFLGRLSRLALHPRELLAQWSEGHQEFNLPRRLVVFTHCSKTYAYYDYDDDESL